MTKTTTKNKDVAARKAAEPAAVAQPASPEAKRRPKTFTLGDVSASVWSRDLVVRGEPRKFYSVTFERSYRDRDGQFRYTRSFNPNDLGALMTLCQQAGEYINEAQNLVPATAED